MQARFSAQREDLFFNLSGVLMVLILSLVVLLNWQGWAVSGPQVALLIGFAAMLTRQPAIGGPYSRAYLYLGTQLLILVFALAYSPLFIFLFYILSVQALMLLPMRTGLGWVMLFTAITGFVTFYHDFRPYEDLVTTLVNGAGFFFFGAFGNALVRAQRARDESQRILAELTDAHVRLQRYAEQAESLAVAEERNRLSREMHDTLGHRLTVSIVQLEGAGRLLERDRQRAGQMVQTVREQLVEGLAELRTTLAALRDSGVGPSLTKSLQTLASEYTQATALPVYLSLPRDLLALDEARRMTLYRAAQEGLTNTQRHAGANAVWLELQETESGLTLEVEDDGIGLPPEGIRPGIGLRGMQERAQQLGGTLDIGVSSRGGVGLRLWLPLGEERANGKE
ncbi:MAG: sensor histidine kinase [Caldilineaceae bacterium]|nr:sensor histidine kinase [Caldilineaceae bacterium]